jgi:hypothetical protein
MFCFPPSFSYIHVLDNLMPVPASKSSFQHRLRPFPLRPVVLQTRATLEHLSWSFHLLPYIGISSTVLAMGL